MKKTMCAGGGRSSLKFAGLFVAASVLFAACGHPDSRELSPAPDTESEGGGRGSNGGKGGTSNGGAGLGAVAGDDGEAGGFGGCSPDCDVTPTCGDGKLEAPEACDDGNLGPGDGCDQHCQLEKCGNGRVDAGEECDPPKSGVCTGNCKLPSARCGDGKIQTGDGETCDDGNEVAGDGCTDCRKDCGDERIDAAAGEECEPKWAPDRCSKDCKWLPFCNDGILQPSAGEQCEPSNGVTCVDCRIVVPPTCEDGGEGGCGGAPGDDCVPQPSQNLIANGSFQTDSAGWQPHSSLVTLTSANDGSPAPGALDVSIANGTGRAESGAFQCIPVQPNQSYTLQAQYRIPSDAPSGVGATVTGLLYAGSQCQGAFVTPPRSGQLGTVRDSWTPYQFMFDTKGLPAGTSDARLLVRLDVVRPGAVDHGHVLWDTVSLTSGGGLCGNCTVDAGEACDDGSKNGTPADGCSSGCQLVRCGDGVRASTEECDTGSTAFYAGDACTPGCRVPTDCDICAGCRDQLASCLSATGAANDGPRAGSARSTLCDALYACVRRTDCDRAERATAEGKSGAYLENCYCGTSGTDCFEKRGAANGSCHAEVEAALETSEPQTVLERFHGDDRYGLFTAVSNLLACEDTSGGVCATVCGTRKPSCGDGAIEDRDSTSFPFDFVIDGKEVPCADELTSSGRGCSVEECDDHNTKVGDGCDANCFIETCGNNVTQAGEECDHGENNGKMGDGCSLECKALYHCGAQAVDRPTECAAPDADPTTAHVCSPGEYAATPTQCGCGSACRRIVCGDGVIDRPAEQCDPPDGLSCGDDCKRLNQSPCETCIEGDMDLQSFNDTYCNVDRRCVDVKQCVVESGCMYPQDSDCYCGVGTDKDACGQPNFVAVGPCKDQIRAGLGGGSLTNDDVLSRLYDFSSPTGAAMQLLDAAGLRDGNGACANVCSPSSFPPAP